VVDLLERRYAEGRRWQPHELIERGASVAVGLRVADPEWEGWSAVSVYKVFTFEGDDAVLLEDCVDRDDAVAKLSPAA
jgi:hypothetical protein